MRATRPKPLLLLSAMAAIAAGCGEGDGDEAAEDGGTCRTSRSVIGGQPTPAGLYPATGALMTDGQFSCTGTLIAPDAVLTAGHCVSDLFGPQIPGFTLAVNANTVSPSDVHAGLEKVAHPDFNFNAPPYNDIGLLRLAEPFEDIPLAILPSPEDGEMLAADVEVEIVGYGLTEVDGTKAGRKHHATTHLAEVTEYELLVAFPGEPQNCRGDSGGPSFLEVDGAGSRIVGVVSGGPEPCVEGGYHTRVDAYLEWIEDHIQTDCGGRGDPCPIADAGPGHEIDAGSQCR